MDDGSYRKASLVLAEAAEKLRALGFNFSLQRTAEMPQGKVLTLHVATAPRAAAAASVALGQGSYSATSPKTASQLEGLIAEGMSCGLVDTIPDWCCTPLAEDPRHRE